MTEMVTIDGTTTEATTKIFEEKTNCSHLCGVWVGSKYTKIDMQSISPTESGSGSFIGDVVDDGSRQTDLMERDAKDSITQLITGSGMSERSEDSPTMSRTSSDSDEIIDHTAALLGFIDDFEDDDDDLREISGFSPSVSLDLELEPMGNDEERNARFEEIFSGDELDGDEAPSQQARSVKPIQLKFPPAAVKRTSRSHGEFQDNGAPIKQTQRGAKQSSAKTITLADDTPFFYFDSRLVAQAVEEYGQRKRKDMDNKRKQAAQKAKSLKEKATSAISHKAKKAVSLPHAIMERKSRASRDELEQHGNENGKPGAGEPDSAHGISKAAAMKLKAKVAFNEKAQKAMDKMPLPKAIKERKHKNSQEPQGEHDKESLEALYARMRGVKVPNMTTPPDMRVYIEGLASRSVIGDIHINKLVKAVSSAQITGDGQPDIVQSGSNPPAITTCPSTISSNKSEVIDEAGFIISPTSSIDLISPVTSFDGVDAPSSVASPRGSVHRGQLPPAGIASPRANRSQLPPSGKKGPKNQTKEAPNKIKLNLSKTKPKDHRRTTTASF